MKFTVAPGETSVRRIRIRILKDDGKANTSLVYNSAGLSASYQIDDGAPVPITLATLSSSSAAYSPGGFVHVGNGWYRIDPPAGAIPAAGAGSDVLIIFAEATDIRPGECQIEADVRASTRQADLPTMGAYWGQAYSEAAGTAGTAGGITLASAPAQSLLGWWILTTGGTGLRQIRQITAHTAGTTAASVAPSWTVTPQAGTNYTLIPRGAMDVGTIARTVVLVPGTVGGMALLDANGLVAADAKRLSNRTLDFNPVQTSVAIGATIAATGDQMTLTAGERTNIGTAVAAAILLTPANKLATDASGRVTVGAILSTVQDTLATAIQAGIINEGDGQQVLAAIVAKINATNVDLAGLSTTSIAAAVWQFLLADAATAGSTGKFLRDLLNGAASVPATGNWLATNDARLAHLDADVSDAIDAAVTAIAASVAAKNAAEAVPTADAIREAVWTRTVRALTDKDGFALSTAARATLVQELADASIQLTDLVQAIRDDLERTGGKLDLVSLGNGQASPLLLEILSMLQTDPPTQTGQQQSRGRKYVRGDTIGPTGRDFTVVKHRSSEWPLDLDGWAWAFTAKKQKDNDNAGGTLAGTAATLVATGEGRAAVVTITSDTSEAAIGRHVYAVHGTKAGATWTIELGTIDMSDTPAVGA